MSFLFVALGGALGAVLLLELPVLGKGYLKTLFFFGKQGYVVALPHSQHSLLKRSICLRRNNTRSADCMWH